MYSGQKPSRLVRMKIPEKISRIMARIPDMTFAKYNAITMTAISILITLSINPMFFFIVCNIKVYKDDDLPAKIMKK
jgi:hypothetical protein